MNPKAEASVRKSSAVDYGPSDPPPPNLQIRREPPFVRRLSAVVPIPPATVDLPSVLAAVVGWPSSIGAATFCEVKCVYAFLVYELCGVISEVKWIAER